MKQEYNKPAKILPQLPDDPRLNMVKRVTRLMDEEFSIGGFKFGLDPILNFLPVAGDVGGYIISIALIFTMLQHGVSGKLAMKMVGNATLDAVIGAIPVLGWVFDFTYKANTRNVKLLAEHYTEGKHKGSAAPVIISVLLSAIIVVALLAVISVMFIVWFIRYLDKIAPLPALN